MNLVTPDSWGSYLREYNHNHDSKTGEFSSGEGVTADKHILGVIGQYGNVELKNVKDRMVTHGQVFNGVYPANRRFSAGKAVYPASDAGKAVVVWGEQPSEEDRVAVEDALYKAGAQLPARHHWNATEPHGRFMGNDDD